MIYIIILLLIWVSPAAQWQTKVWKIMSEDSLTWTDKFSWGLLNLYSKFWSKIIITQNFKKKKKISMSYFLILIFNVSYFIFSCEFNIEQITDIELIFCAFIKMLNNFLSWLNRLRKLAALLQSCCGMLSHISHLYVWYANDCVICW